MFVSHSDATSELHAASPERQRKFLDQAYLDFHSHFFLEKDPVAIVHRFRNPEDQELVAFISSLLAYGNVRTILNSIERVIGPMGSNPKQYLLSKPEWKHLDGFKHRFTTGDDMRIVFCWLQEIFRSYGTLEKFFVAEPYTHFTSQISSFVQRLSQLPLPKSLASKKRLRTRSLKYLISDPERGSACKRLNLFLRWMVRRPDGLDLGIWKSLSPKDLLLPVDTHLLKVLRDLGWTNSQTATWKVVLDATAQLKAIDPEDPIKYDFSLCHLSMEGHSIRRYSVAPE